MTINQAKGLRVGQVVSNITTEYKGEVLHHKRFGLYIHWYGWGPQYHCYKTMNSIHIMAN